MALKAVPRDARPVRPAAPRTIRQAADSSERELLVALRTHLASEMDKGAVPAHALASVSAKIREYDRDIRALDAQDKQEAVTGEKVGDAAFDASAV